MEEKIQRLISQIKIVKSGAGPNRFPEGLKKEILTVYEASAARTALAQRLGIGPSTIAFWRQQRPKAKRPQPSAKFKPMLVTQSPLRLPNPRLIFPGGAAVENLSEELILRIFSHALSPR